MQKPQVSKSKIKSAEGLPKSLGPDSVLFGRLALAFFWSIGLSNYSVLGGGVEHVLIINIFPSF